MKNTIIKFVEKCHYENIDHNFFIGIKYFGHLKNKLGNNK